MQASLDIFNHILTNIFYFQILQASGSKLFFFFSKSPFFTYFKLFYI